MGKISVFMNKPVYFGPAILDLSKIIMYKFHYDYMLPKYGENLWLCYMDTDSFVYEMKTSDFYEDIYDGDFYEDIALRLVLTQAATTLIAPLP